MYYNDGFGIDTVLKKNPYPCLICGKWKHDHFLEDRIHYAMANKETMFIAWIGKSRKGKSWSEIIHGCYIFDSDHFNCDNIIFPTSSDLKELREWYLTHTHSLCVLEEISSSDVTEWWTVASKMLRYIIDTQGFRCNVLFLNSPRLSAFPKSVKDSISYRVICNRKGTFVTNRIDARLIIHDWKSDNEKVRYKTVSNVIPIKIPDDTRVKLMLSEYESMKQRWADKSLLDGFNLLSGKKENKDDQVHFLKPFQPIL